LANCLYFDVPPRSTDTRFVREFSDQWVFGTYGQPPLTSLFVRFSVLRCVISADDLSVWWYRSARHSFSPVDLVIVCTVLVLDTFVRPVFFCALVRFRFFIFPCSLHIDDLSCNDRFTTRAYVLFLLPARNIDDPLLPRRKESGPKRE